MAYADLLTVQTLNTGDILTAACMTQVRNNGEFFIDPPAASVFNSAVQSISNNTTTALTANSENFDNASMHSTSVNTARITITTAGRYLFLATVLFANSATGYRRVSFRVDGATAYGGISGLVDAANVGARITAGRSLVLTAGQYVEVTCLQTSGGALDATLEEFVAIFMTR